MTARYSKFAFVGACGFIVDASVYALLAITVSEPVENRIIAFWAAATMTWLGNRYLTFGDIGFSSNKRQMLTQFFRHFAAAHFSGLLNLTAFYLLLDITNQPIAFVTGVLIGMFCNYMFSIRLVFVN